MSPKVRNIIIATALVAVLATLYFVRRNATMRGVDITVTHGGAELLTPPEVDSLLAIGFPQLKHTSIKDLDSRAIREHLERHPYILKVDVDVTWGGKLIVNVTQRDPVVRVFYEGNEFYLSHEGTCMPLCPKHYCNIVVGSSDYKEPRLKRPTQLQLSQEGGERPAALLRIWQLASFFYENPRYGDVFDQIYVGSDGKLYAVPKLSSLYIVVGDAEELQTKFENLWAFFDQGINQVGWDTYSAISLEYEGQVVCTRAEAQ